MYIFLAIQFPTLLLLATHRRQCRLFEHSLNNRTCIVLLSRVPYIFSSIAILCSIYYLIQCDVLQYFSARSFSVAPLAT